MSKLKRKALALSSSFLDEIMNFIKFQKVYRLPGGGPTGLSGGRISTF
jgi:hypothetical protein